MLPPELEDFQEAWTATCEAEVKDRTVPLDLVRKFFGKNRELAAEFEPLSLEELVAEIDKAREDGDAERVVLIDAYILATYPPQHIRGVGAVDAMKQGGR